MIRSESVYRERKGEKDASAAVKLFFFCGGAEGAERKEVEAIERPAEGL